MALLAKTSHDVVTLMASATKTITGVTTRVPLPGMVNAFALTLDVTAAATAVGDTLNVTVQTKVDGTNWLDVCAFTEVVGDGGAKTYVEKIVAQLTEAGFETGATLAAGAVRNLIGDDWRVSWTIVDADADDASFTFSVTACPM
jgi:hypothetical protein